MKYTKLGTTLGVTTGIMALSVSSGGFASIATAQTTSDMSRTTHANQMSQRYRVNLRPLNNSGVHGVANIILTGRELTVSVRASGMTPNMTHAQHIHGQKSGAGAAECPTAAQDINMDNFISVTEGAPTYGPIKLNLTNPQTPFGPNDTVLNGVKLFTDFAGKPAPENFPKADANGNLSFSNTYIFDTNDAAANAAFETLNPLTDQEVVLHGAPAPSGVETAAGGGATMAYDALLPVACARITAVGNQHQQRNNGNNRGNGQGNGSEHGSISNTGSGSNTSISSTSSENSVNVSNQNNRTTVSGGAASSNNTSGGRGSGSNGQNITDWMDMDPSDRQANSQGFNEWWSRMNQRMTQYNANDWMLGTAANNNWSPSGSDWQSSWSNWDPALWQANGQSYGNWYGQMLGYMTSNYSNWNQNWDSSDDGANVTSGNAMNHNSGQSDVTTRNRN